MSTYKYHPISLLDQDWYRFTYQMTNSYSVDPDQLVSEEANWSGSTLFAKAGYIWVQQNQGCPIIWTFALYFLLMCLKTCWMTAYTLIRCHRMCIHLVIRRLQDWSRRVWQHSFTEIHHEVFSTVIFSLPLIQEGWLVTLVQKDNNFLYILMFLVQKYKNSLYILMAL